MQLRTSRQTYLLLCGLSRWRLLLGIRWSWLSLLLLLLWVLLRRRLARLLLLAWGRLPLAWLLWRAGRLPLWGRSSDLLGLLWALLARRCLAAGVGARLLLLLLGHRPELGLQLVNLLRQVEFLLLARGQDLQESLQLRLGLLQFISHSLQLGPELVPLLLETLGLLLQLAHELLLLFRLSLVAGRRRLLLLLLLLLYLFRQIGQLLALALERLFALLKLPLVVLQLALLGLQVLSRFILLALQVCHLVLLIDCSS